MDQGHWLKLGPRPPIQRGLHERWLGRAIERFAKSIPHLVQLWHQYNTAYGCAKQTLTMILKLIIEVTGSGLFEEGSTQHQRFKDALIYSTHMKNLYFSTKQNLYQWTHIFITTKASTVVMENFSITKLMLFLKFPVK